PVVLSIGDEDPSALVDREGVQTAELSRRITGLAPGLEEPAVLAEFHDAIVAVHLVTVGDEDVAVLRNGHRAGRLEVALVIARHARLAEREQYFAVRTELDNLMTGFDAALGRERDALRADRVGHPDVTLLIHEEPVGPDEDASSEALDDLAIGREL